MREDHENNEVKYAIFYIQGKENARSEIGPAQERGRKSECGAVYVRGILEVQTIERMTTYRLKVVQIFMTRFAFLGPPIPSPSHAREQ